MFILIRMLTFFFDQGTPKNSQSQWQRKKRNRLNFQPPTEPRRLGHDSC
jgi:hypothetical protein